MPQHKFGFKKSIPHPDDKKYHLAPHYTAGVALPTSCDLRSKCPPVYDQGDLGSCTANAGSGAVEYDMRVQNQKVVTPSRLFLYYNERNLDGDVDTDAGSSLRTCIRAINQFGVCNDELWPYNPSQFAVRPPVDAYAQAKMHRGVKSFSINQTLYDLQHCLAVFGRPILFGFEVYESFESQQVATTGVMPMPSPGENCLGGHAVLIVGYEPGYFIVRNSWGPNWGLGGYFKMPFEYATNASYCSDFWCLQEIN